MAINSAMYNGVAGLNSFSTALEVTSDNVANIGTTAYKANSIRFGDMVSSYYNTQSKDTDRRGAGSVVLGIATDFSQGSSISSTTWSDMLINGDGFFAMSQLDDQGNLVNPNQVYYTRDGGFTLDKNGYLTNYQGYAVLNTNGDPIYVGDPKDPTYANFYVDSAGQIYGTPVGVGATVGGAAITSAGANTDPTITAATFTVPAGGSTLTITNAAGDVVGTITDTVAGTKNVDLAYLQAHGVPIEDGDYTMAVTTGSIVPPTLTVSGGTSRGQYTLSQADTVTLSVRDAETGKIVATANYAGTAGSTTIDMAFLEAQGIHLGNGNYTFDVKPQGSATSVTIDDSSIGVVGAALTASGNYTISNPAGVSITIRNADGDVVESLSLPADSVGTYPQTVTVDQALLAANGISLGNGNYTIQVAVTTDPVPITDAQLRVSLFPNEQGLIRKGGNLYATGPESKDPIHGTADDGMRGAINGYTIEGSNVDLAKEMVNMIMYQSNYNANTKSITTGRDMLDTTINLVR